MKKRPRGRAYECACGEEKLRLSRSGPDASHNGWVYLWGECGGGVKLRLDGARIAETRAVEEAEAKRVKALPVRRIEPFDAMVARLDDRQKDRLTVLTAEIREALREGMKQFLVVGKLLADAKRVLQDDRGAFTVWVQHNSFDPNSAYKFIAIHEAARSTPGLSQTFGRIGQEKAALLTRLPEAKRAEVLEDGVLVEGKRKPLEQATFRELNTYVRSVVGKSARGRKPGAKGKDEKKQRYGLAVDLFDLFHQTIDGLKRLEKFAAAGWTDEQRKPVANLWRHVNRRFWTLQTDYKMGDLLEDR